MGRNRYDRAAHETVAAKVRAAGGDVSAPAKQRQAEGLGLHALVDPSKYGVVRRALRRHDTGAVPGRFVNAVGVPVAAEFLSDTTASMGENVAKIFNVLPLLFSLLTTGSAPVLGGYDPQIITAFFGDYQDRRFVLTRSQAEALADRIAEQLTFVNPERDGGDWTEDPQYGLLAAAYFTDAFITRYPGMKTYHFLVTDADARTTVDADQMIRIFGENVFTLLTERGMLFGRTFDRTHLPDLFAIMEDLKKRSHVFMINVRGGEEARSFWEKFYGKERVISVADTTTLHYVIATLIGLTEGVWNLQTVVPNLKEYGCDEATARRIARAVASVPYAEQCKSPVFGNIPPKGSVFASKTDLWPIQEDEEQDVAGEENKAGEGEVWL